jgi:hypothetical protein
MTLNEKLLKVKLRDWDPNAIEKIADEFAIGFAEWILDWPEDWHRIEELLEIYKKEKGL